MGLEYEIIRTFEHSVQSVYRETFSLEQADGTALENATGAEFQLVLTGDDGTTLTVTDTAGSVTASTASTVAVEISPSQWATFTPPTTVKGWLYYTPDGGEREALAKWSGIRLVEG